MSKRDAIDQLLGKRCSQGIQETVNTGIQKPVNKKKATFDFNDHGRIGLWGFVHFSGHRAQS
ncbi:hypothetical protein ACFPES_24480 [Paenibacillus sp. GCM10023248]|uniref:hypothetical protein n=1 Tax=Bacillales TaxID=1385 RepID=UPI0023781CDB|nr:MULTISPECIES: hypothetical protein [Bacillales]MDD9270219.1 hypothetical protein [Paenibacillus sp. MAHUQ-63]MDR6880353.1 hypothetical protein [Bacillus sp. 3255]